MVTKKPNVSLTVVTRNRAAELAQALRSVQAQSEAVGQIVVVDNASEDNTTNMLARDFPEVQLIRLQHNIGCQPARNIAMAKCQGDIIFNLDDDGTLHPEAIKNTIACFTKHPEVGLVSASVRVPENKAKLYPHSHHDKTWHYTSHFFGGASALRREVLAQAGYFPEYFRGHSESDLSLRIIHSGWEMLYHPGVIMYHHISHIERNRNTETYYQVRHQLETSARLQPALTAWTQILWRIAQGFVISIPKGVFPGYLKGVSLFLLTLPKSLRQRKPVSKEASRKHHYLKHHPVQDLAELPDFNRYGFMMMMRSRMGRDKGGTNKSAAATDLTANDKTSGTAGNPTQMAKTKTEKSAAATDPTAIDKTSGPASNPAGAGTRTSQPNTHPTKKNKPDTR